MRAHRSDARLTAVTPRVLRRRMSHRPQGASNTVIVGYAFAVLLPVAGVILGVLVLSNGPRNHGIGILALSIVVGVVSYLWLF
jgi:hypothetical protein